MGPAISRTAKEARAAYRKRVKTRGCTLLPLLPRYGIYLEIEPATYANITSFVSRRADTLRQAKHLPELVKRLHQKPGERLASLFRVTWKRMPLTARRTILEWWRQLIVIVLLTDKDEFGRGRFAGTCSLLGTELRFEPIACDALNSDDYICGIIAHELAHVFRIATLGNSSDTDARLYDTTTNEIETRELAESWGFPQTKFRRNDYRRELYHERKRKGK